MKLRIAAAAILILMIVSVCISALQTTRSVREGVYTEAQQKRGEKAFADNCSSCHGHDLNGGEIAPALFGPNFMANWNGLSVGDLSERIRISMPPPNPESVSAQQRIDIISLILNANSLPAGQKELESRTEVLKQIKIEPAK